MFVRNVRIKMRILDMNVLVNMGISKDLGKLFVVKSYVLKIRKFLIVDVKMDFIKILTILKM